MPCPCRPDAAPAPAWVRSGGFPPPVEKPIYNGPCVHLGWITEIELGHQGPFHKGTVMARSRCGLLARAGGGSALLPTCESLPFPEPRKLR